MRILLVTAEPPCPPLNGLGKFVCEFKQEAAKQMELKALSLQLDPFLIPADKIPTATDEQRSDYTIRIEPDGYSEEPEARYLLAAHKALPAIKAILKDFKPDLIYIHSLKAWIPFRYEKNVVMAFHGLTRDIIGNEIPDAFMAFQEKIEIEAAQKSAAVVLFSRFMEHRWRAAYGIPCRITRLPLGINLSVYRSAKSSDSFTIAYFGRLIDRHKGYSLFLEATRELPLRSGDGRSVQIHVYGDGEALDPARYPHAVFHGHQSGQALLDAFAAADCIVMPSLYEPFGIVGLEAMASGALLLAPRGQGMGEYTRPGSNSLEISLSAESIRRRLEDVIQSPSDYSLYVKNAQEDVQAWSISASVASHLDFFKGLIQELASSPKIVNTPSVGRVNGAALDADTPGAAPA